MNLGLSTLAAVGVIAECPINLVTSAGYVGFT